ncbi:MAG: ABC transporter ATP-binding protein [Pirellulales bacterium]
MIELRDVSQIYRTAHGDVRALDHVSLAVSQGEFVAIRGPSGCGKTTLLMLVGGLALATEGDVVVARRSLAALSRAERAQFRAREIGFVFQTFHLLPYLNVVDNVLAASIDGSRRETVQRADALLERFALADRRTHRPGQLSTGERQRVALARALLNQPGIVLADEPTGNLDPENGRIVLDLLAEYHRDGGTVLLVTHEDQAAARAKRCIRLERGRAIGVGDGNLVAASR